MYDLFNDNSEINFHFNDWHNILELAQQYGWSPKGTVPGNFTYEDNWNGSYFGNAWQYVLPDDAINIGKALELAILDFPEPGTYVPFNSEIKIDGESFVDLDELISNQEELYDNFSIELLLKKFSGKGSRILVKKFIAFCNEGCGFFIS
ncbi:MAG TPA: hypothetical protein PKG96_08140 [Bacilli bacterium]|jgi:hypothetical protein|nr:hypothetical protein [Bacilli bacterium]